MLEAVPIAYHGMVLSLFGSVLVSWLGVATSGLFRFEGPSVAVMVLDAVVPALLPPVVLGAAVLLAELPPVSSRRKLGPAPVSGVEKFRGLATVLLSFPRNPHSW